MLSATFIFEVEIKGANALGLEARNTDTSVREREQGIVKLCEFGLDW